MDKSLKILARHQLRKYEYWFRKKYNLSPHDPRFLNCEPWEFELEYEIEQAANDEEESLRNVCPICGSVVYGNYCYKCKKPVPTERYTDPDWESYAAKVEAENSAFSKELSDTSSWEEVK